MKAFLKASQSIIEYALIVSLSFVMVPDVIGLGRQSHAVTLSARRAIEFHLILNSNLSSFFLVSLSFVLYLTLYSPCT